MKEEQKEGSSIDYPYKQFDLLFALDGTRIRERYT